MNHTSKKKYNWTKVQEYHDAGHGVLETIKHFGMAKRTWEKAIIRKDIISNVKQFDINTTLVENGSHDSNGLKRRLIKAGLLENKCYKCGLLNIWQGEEIVLQLHHINGIGNDNRFENLTILCPNCHSQTSNYGTKNLKRTI